jgi:hypothetical protein
VPPESISDRDFGVLEGACALAAESIGRFGRLRLRVTGHSMLPAIRPGDLVHFRACRHDEAVSGDILIYRRNSRLVVHRLLRHESDGLLTQGDSLPGPDALVGHSDFLGLATSVHRRGRDVSASTFRPTMQHRMGRWLIRNSQLATRLFLRWHRHTSARQAA